MSADMADIVNVSSRYKEDVPLQCFTSKVPFVMRAAPDHRIVPSQDMHLLSPGGTTSKWIRAARFEDLLHACHTYLTSTAGIIMHDRLNVFVMPYMPVEDAFRLHELIENPDPLPGTYADAVSLLQAQFEGEAINPGATMGGMEEEKRGTIRMAEFDVDMKFFISNYEVLWSKSRTQCMLSFLSDPMIQFVELATICDHILGNKDSDEEADDAIIEEAKRQLIFAMHQSDASDADVHHVIAGMYPAIHSAVYQNCHHCDVMTDFDEAVNSPETSKRLESSLAFLGYDKEYTYQNVEDAEYKLMMAEGRAEYNKYNAKTKEEFATARELMTNSLTPLIHQIVLARRQYSLMGVTD